MSFRFLLLAAALFGATPALANVPPVAPGITEPEIEGQIVNPADVHMETTPFSDPDTGADGQFRGTDYEIWSVTPSQRVWASLNVSGVESFHTHLGDGVFEGSHAGRNDLLFNTGYLLRVRHRDNSNQAATEYSTWATRNFTTGGASAIFPILLLDILATPAPAWQNSANAPVILPAGTTPPKLIVRTEENSDLLVISGLDGISNSIVNPPAGDHDHAFKVIFESGSQTLSLPPTTLVFSDNLAISHTVYLPSLSIPAGQVKVLWVSQNGSTYQGSLADVGPDFSTLARGSAVPWLVRQPGYVVEVVATGFQMPVNIAFIPNPASGPTAPLYYVTELYGTIKVVRRNGVVSDYASGLLNYTPSGAFPGSGEQGVGGIAIDPATGDVFLAVLRSNAGTGNNPRILKFTSTDGGLTAATQTTLLNMAPEQQGQSHFCSNLSIGPDGKLYSHQGDGFDAGTALNLDQFRGKILRLNLDGSAPTDNPFYNAANGINARDYVWAYGFRNPFGGAWRNSDASHYEVENGPSTDRFAKVTAGTSYGWAGGNEDMLINALYNWGTATGPVNISFVQPTVFSGSQFPVAKMDRAYVTLSGPTYGAGPQGLGKRIEEFNISPAGTLTGSPSTLIEYNGSGRATACGLAAGPDGLYFTDLYKDLDTTGPTDRGANVLRVRYTGSASFTADVTSGPLPLAVQFANSSEVPGATSYLWDFGDGATSTLQNPSHTYTAEGIYSVLLSVTGPNGVVQSRRASYIAAGVIRPALTYRFYRFTPTKLRDDGTANSVQVAEFDFLLSGNSVIGGGSPIVTNPGGDSPGGEGPPNLVDGNAGKKWLDFNKGAAVFDFTDATQIDSYSFTTANDAIERDPVSWTLEGSDDGDFWELLDTQTDYDVPTARFAVIPPIFPETGSLAPVITAFTASPTSIEPGQTSTLTWSTQAADTVTLLPGFGSVSASGTQNVTLNAGQTYTLTATNASGSTTATVTVNVAASGQVTYRWFRFTPTKLRDNLAANSVQLAEFDLYLGATEITGAAATNPNRDGVVGEEASKAVDQNPNTKWNDHNKGQLILEYPAPVTIDRYGYVTANDTPVRDPVSWTLEGSPNGTAWTLLHTVTDHPTTVNRFSNVGPFLIPAQPRRVLFVVAEATNPNLSEVNIAAAVTALGFTVQYITDSLSTTADAAGKSLILIASSVTSSQVNTKFRDVAVPILNWESALFDDLAMTGLTAGTDFGTTGGQTDLVITNPSHPLAAGHTGQNDVFGVSGIMSWGNPNANAARVASVVGSPDQAAIFAYETGAAMVGINAPARRVGFFLTDISGEALTGHGIHLLERAVVWATNTPPQILFTAPSANATYLPGQPIYIAAAVNDNNVAGVEFRADGAILASMVNPPYQFTWTNPAGGPHLLTATAFDQAGESATALPVTIAVLSPYENFRRASFNPAQLLNPAISGPGVDFDNDGYKNFMEHFLAMNPTIADRPTISTGVVTVGLSRFGTYSYRHVIAATDVSAIPEASVTLNVWEAGGDRLVQTGFIDHGDGTRTVTFRSLLPDLSKEFFHLRLTGP